MLFSSIYPVAFLLASVGTVHCAGTIETITVISTIVKDIQQNDPNFWNASKVHVVKQDLFSPAIVIEILESYTKLLQSPAIRCNYQLRGAKGASHALSSRCQTFEDWWARRRWPAVPSDPMWFQGTLAEGLIDTVNSTVHRHVPQMYTMSRHLDVESENEQSNQEQTDFHYTKLRTDAEKAVTALNAAVEGQSKSIPRIDPMVSTIAARARRFADNLEEFHRIMAYCIKRSGSRNTGDDSGPNVNSKMQTMNDIISQMSDSVFRHSNSLASKPTIQDDGSLDEKISKLYIRYVLDFLEDREVSTDGFIARQGIHDTYEQLRNGLQLTQGIQDVADRVLASTRKALEKQQQGETYKWAQISVEEMATNLDRTRLLSGFTQALVTNATELTRDMDMANRRWADEAAALISRAKGLEPQDEGEEPKLGKRVQTINPQTGLPLTTQYLYEYEIRAPWKMAGDIRKAVDQLEYVWSTVVSCEDELAYMDICEATNLDPEKKKQELRRRFRLPSGRGDRDVPSCDSFSNPLLMKRICIDEYKL
ncbi:uncharacterized protein F4807DRAFT_463304 [Annulohypoxylon truncatum]|uniref:uncharacterized protein n=1 Tax=Annulohypoxylon truncatum TaxID=327061 RepID=UPI002008A250|nr:uncharacterized protein F4807DRAFT_463304 [Annulohypoxylon truncatum]KAI1206905.1 hypothetical protein F4807DRAFT_463304 [Annulohypoxylon truncatum]